MRAGRDSEQSERRDDSEMQELRQKPSAPFAEAGRDGRDPLAEVEIPIHERVEDVEPGDPERDRREQQPGAGFEAARDRDPRAERSKRVYCTEEEMHSPRDALDVWID